ncbi:hypothetical protein [Sphingomonas phyllosphaerae]|uniref:hypothetical protein n=1 Tax=Sphingomonas phyllosphaerae TaxID=257003 RepID=UPI00048C9FFC|nr:hypothetical protein [Sphingomonas phyllosphaerae]
MTFHKLLLPVTALLAIVTGTASPAVAQFRDNQAYRPSNAQQTKDMRSRLAAAIDRVRVTEQHGKLSPARSAALRNQLMQAQRQMVGFERQQGFVSAAELASYDRLVVGIDAELGDVSGRRSYGNDALPSAEVKAFQRLDKRLSYRDARIEYDAKGCAVYQGKARSGRIRQEVLRDPRGRAICPRR